MLSDARSSSKQQAEAAGSMWLQGRSLAGEGVRGRGAAGLEKTKMNKSTPYNNDYEPLTLNGKENAGLQITPATSRSSSNISQQQQLQQTATTTKGMRHRNPSNATAKNNTKLQEEQQQQQQM